MGYTHAGQARGAACIVLAFTALLALPIRAAAQGVIPPGKLVHEAVANELKDDSQTYLYSWKERTKRGQDTIVERDVDTPQGTVSRVLLINDKPLDAAQQRAEEARIRKATDPDRMRRKQRESQADDVRTRKILASIPDAFNFTYVDTQQAPNGHTLVTLKFTPRPDFNPPNRETRVFTGMGGTLVVDETAMRLVKVDGTLFRDVDFGWGIFGRLYKGGRFVIEKVELTPTHWDTSRTYLHFDGKVLLFKSLHIDVDETDWDYKPVRPMTVTEALDFLNHSETAAQNAKLSRESSPAAR
jgi:hypothetical protein